MGWKNWPAWVKGGVIGIIFLIVIFVLKRNFANIILSIFTLPVYVIVLSLPDSLYNVAFFILTPIFYFLLGALIGLVISKIKSKKKA